MTQENFQEQWHTYCQSELSLLTPLLQQTGYTLDVLQPHIQGERFLQKAVTTQSGKKLILYGTTAQGKKVVIKATRDADGKKEIIHERTCKQFLSDINFAASVLVTPTEVAYFEKDTFLISIQEFIPQPCSFLERPVQEQFAFALSAFKAQEGAHATTYSHKKRISEVYPLWTQEKYRAQFFIFADTLSSDSTLGRSIPTLLKQAAEILDAHKTTIEQYGDFLTHTDFVPHNFRIDESGTMYLLDHASFVFGNKYEGWARFLNFMSLYNRELEQALTYYVAQNRSRGEQESLWLMRIYRLGEIMWYYHNVSQYSHGNLLELNCARIQFWGDVLAACLQRQPVDPAIIHSYTHLRDRLRSSDEKERQKNLH